MLTFSPSGDEEALTLWNMCRDFSIEEFSKMYEVTVLQQGRSFAIMPTRPSNRNRVLPFCFSS